MSRRFTWFWLAIAAGLFAFIFFVRPRLHHHASGPSKLFPDLVPAEVISIRVHPKDQAEIHVVRTNNSWELIEPLVYPAHSARVEYFLASLQKLIPAVAISPGELKNLPKSDQDFGLDPPQISVLLEQARSRTQFQIGLKTGPGDQIFCRLGGEETIAVVDAALLQTVPRTANDWRQTAFLNLKEAAFDSLAVTNGANMSVLSRDPAAGVWRMTFPISARADTLKIDQALAQLQALQILQFLPDDVRADSEPLGLQPAELELVLRQGTNIVAWAQFGKSPTNSAQLQYARLLSRGSVVLLPKAPLAPWYSPAYGFRDPHLVSFSQPVNAIDIRGLDTFSLQRSPSPSTPDTQSSNSWRVLPQNFPADAVLVRDLLSAFTVMQAQFIKAVVVEPDLPVYGLTAPARQYTIKSITNCPTGLTNVVLADLTFGTNAENKVFVRRADEDSVYSINLTDFQALPAASWQLRERQIWNFTEQDVAEVVITGHGKTRQLHNKGDHEWALAPGSQGSIEPFAVDQTVRGLGSLAAIAWAARGAAERSKFGFTADGHQITLNLKNGNRLAIEFGGPGPSQLQFAGVKLDDDFWIFALDSKLYRDVQLYLSIP